VPPRTDTADRQHRKRGRSEHDQQAEPPRVLDRESRQTRPRERLVLSERSHLGAPTRQLSRGREYFEPTRIDEGGSENRHPGDGEAPQVVRRYPGPGEQAPPGVDGEEEHR
jgi:hypothetical protein